MITDTLSSNSAVAGYRHGARPAYFVVNGIEEWSSTYEEVQDQKRYFYESHTCPRNFINAEMIARNGDTDPHVLFRFVAQLWMTWEYETYENEASDEYLCAVFPQIVADHKTRD